MLRIKWSKLTPTQRKQVEKFYDGKDGIDFIEHDYNSRTFKVDVNSGNVLFYKDF